MKFNFLAYLKNNNDYTDCTCCNKSAEFSRPLINGIGRDGLYHQYNFCMKCGAVFKPYRVNQSNYAKFYKSRDYNKMVILLKQKAGKKTKAKAKNAINSSKSHGHRFIKEFGNYIPKNGTILDIGAGNGSWLVGINERRPDLNLIALEPSKDHIERIQKLLPKNKHYCGTAEDLYEIILKDQMSKINLIIISGSLQHSLSPFKVVELCKKLLSKDGYLYMCNQDLFDHYTNPFLRNPYELKNLMTIDHPQYFHIRQYKNLTQSFGFKTIKFSKSSKVRFQRMEILAKNIDLKKTCHYSFLRANYHYFSLLLNNILVKAIKKIKSRIARLKKISSKFIT